MFIKTTQVAFNGHYMVAKIERGMCCPKITTTILQVLKDHYTSSKDQCRTGVYNVHYTEEGLLDSITYQRLGCCDLIQGQFYGWRAVE